VLNYTGTGEQGSDGTVTWSTNNAPASAKVNVTHYLAIGGDVSIIATSLGQNDSLTGTWNEDAQYKNKTVTLIAECYDPTTGTVLAKATKPIKLVGKGEPAIDITVTGSGEAGSAASIAWTTDNAPVDGTLSFQTYFKVDKPSYLRDMPSGTNLASGSISDFWTDDPALAGTTQTITAQLKDGTGKVVADTSDTIQLSGKADIKVETSSATYQATKDGAVNWTSTGAPDGAYVDVDNTYIEGYDVPTEGQLPTDSASGMWTNEPGAHTITVSLKNSDGDELATASTQITIEAAPEPQITLNVTSNTFKAEESGTIEWTITDAPTDSTLHVTTFFSDGDYDGAAESGSTSGKWSAEAVGDQTVEAVINDADGNPLKSEQFPITIEAQPAPEITLTATSDSFIVGTSGTIEWTIVNQPKNGGTLNIVTHLDNGDYEGPAEDGSTTGNWNDEPGTQTITATITVDGVEVATGDTTVTIEPAPTPTVEVTVDAASYYPGDPATINWTITDAPSGAHLHVETFLDSGDYDGPAESGSTNGNWNSDIGAHTITATITQNGDELASGTAEITIEEPPAPEFSLNVDAGSGLEGSGGSISWSISWANENQATGATIDIPDTYLDSGAYTGEAQSGSTSGSWNSDQGYHDITATITTAGGQTYTASGSVEIFLMPAISIDVDTGGGEVGNSGSVSWTVDNAPNGEYIHVSVGSLSCGDYDGAAESGSTSGTWDSAGDFTIEASFSAYGQPFSASTHASISEPPEPPPPPPPPPPPEEEV